jgi:hypothetical protein
LKSLDGLAIAFIKVGRVLDRPKEVIPMAGENWTFWFNMTNFALGMITVLALAVVFGAVGLDLLVRKAPKPRAVNAADLERVGAEIDSWFKAGPHSLTVPGLGLTMADGGEKIEPENKEESRK